MTTRHAGDDEASRSFALKEPLRHCMSSVVYNGWVCHLTESLLRSFINPSFAAVNHRFTATGTKLGCGEGGCGACTVMVSSYDYEEKKISHAAVNACLAPVVSDQQH